MPSVRIWTLESDNDAKAVECLANKLVKHLHLTDLTIRSSGRKAVPKGNRNRTRSGDSLRKAVQYYLRQEDYVVFVYDNDSPMSRHQRQQEPNSLINQVSQILKDQLFKERCS